MPPVHNQTRPFETCLYTIELAYGKISPAKTQASLRNKPGNNEGCRDAETYPALGYNPNEQQAKIIK